MSNIWLDSKPSAMRHDFVENTAEHQTIRFAFDSGNACTVFIEKDGEINYGFSSPFMEIDFSGESPKLIASYEAKTTLFEEVEIAKNWAIMMSNLTSDEQKVTACESIGKNFMLSNWKDL